MKIIKLALPCMFLIIILSVLASAATYLNISDTTSSQSIYSYEQVHFYANFSNSTSPINASNVTCELYLELGSGWESALEMAFNATSLLYEYNRTFTSPGNHTYNISCNGTALGYEHLNATENFTISTDTTAPNSTSVGSGVGYIAANITILLNKTGNVTVDYGLDENTLNTRENSSAFTENHTIQLNGLAENTQYHFNITMCNRDNYCIERGGYTFTTLSSPEDTATLNISDTTSSQSIYSYQQMHFYANFSNSTSPINASNVTCELYFELGSGWESALEMAFNATSLLYEYNRTFTSPGNYTYNVSCNATALGYEHLNATENFTISTDTTAPNSTSVGSGVGYIAANITILLNKTGNVTVDYGTSQAALNSSTYNSSFTENHTIQLNGLAENTQYYFNITMCNRDNYCIERGVYTFTTEEGLDNTSPVIAFTYPSELNTTLYNDWKNLEISISTDEDAVCIIDAYKAGSTTITTDLTMSTSNSRTHSRYINATGDSSGYNFFVTAKCTDDASNEASKTAYFRVNDTTLPAISFVTPTIADNGYTNQQSQTISVTMDEQPYSGYPKVSLDSGSQMPMTYSSGKYSYTYSNLAAAEHNLTVYAKDLKGNENTYARSFTIDTTDPDMDVISPEDDITLNDCNILTINLSLDEDGTCEYELYKFDESRYDTCNDRCDSRYDSCVDSADTTAERTKCRDDQDTCKDECESEKFKEFDNDIIEEEYGVSDCQDDCDTQKDECFDICKDIRSECYDDAEDSDDRDKCSDDYDDCTGDCTIDNGYCYEDCEDEGHLFWLEFTRCYDDADYIAVMSCEDLAGNQVTENSTFTIHDTNAPRIISSGPNGTIYTSRTTLRAETNEKAECRFSEKDIPMQEMENKFSQTTESHSFALVGLEDGNYTYHVLCNDTKGNMMANSHKISFIISSGTATSADDDDDDTEPSLAETKRFSSITADEAAIMVVESSELSLRELSLMLNEDVEDAEITVEKLTSQNLVGAPKDNIYEYFTVSKTGITSKQIDSATLKFRVKKSWLQSKGIDEDDIYLGRYTDKWQEIKTLKTSQDNTYAFYQAETDGLSMFAILGKAKSQDTTPVNTDTKTPDTKNNEPEKTQQEDEPAVVVDEENSWLWLWIFLLCVLVVGGGSAAFVIFRTNRHPQHDLSAANQKQLAHTAAAVSDEAAASSFQQPIGQFQTQNQNDMSSEFAEEQNDIDNYIKNAVAAGLSSKDIKENLLASGFDEEEVDLELKKTGIIKDELSEYISQALSSGMDPDQIYDALVENWHDESDILDKFETLGLKLSAEKSIGRPNYEEEYIEEGPKEKEDDDEENAYKAYENQLKEYITSSLAAGMPIRQIKENLFEAGNAEDKVEDIIDSMQKTQKPAVSEPQMNLTADTKVQSQDKMTGKIRHDLKEYVKGCLEEKMSKYHIKKLLENAGYSKEEIKGIIKEVPKLKKQIKEQKSRDQKQ